MHVGFCVLGGVVISLFFAVVLVVLAQKTIKTIIKFCCLGGILVLPFFCSSIGIHMSPQGCQCGNICLSREETGASNKKRKTIKHQ